MNIVKSLGAATLLAAGLGFAGSANAAPLSGFQPGLTDGGSVQNVHFGFGYGYGYRPYYRLYAPRPRFQYGYGGYRGGYGGYGGYRGGYGGYYGGY